MTCYHPMSGIKTGLKTENGKDDIVIIKARVDSYPEDSFRRLYKDKKYDTRKLSFNPVTFERCFTDIIPIPCGNCLGCRLDKSKEWAVRCLLESKSYEFNYFLTLTYDDEHLPENNSLVKDDLKKFLMRLNSHLRRRGHVGIRYYACGEYGSKNHRPHYHIILFNCPIPNLKFLRVTQNGNKTMCSDDISKLWPYGFHSIGEVNQETCAYTARYVMKKQTGVYSSIYLRNKLQPEFTTMSRKPGIGLEYFENNYTKIYDTDKIVYKSGEHALTIKPSKYYDSKYDLINPEHLSSLKVHRQRIAKITRNNTLINLNMTEKEYLEHQEQEKAVVCSLLKRPL